MMGGYLFSVREDELIPVKRLQDDLDKFIDTHDPKLIVMHPETWKKIWDELTSKNNIYDLDKPQEYHHIEYRCIPVYRSKDIEPGVFK